MENEEVGGSTGGDNTANRPDINGLDAFISTYIDSRHNNLSPHSSILETLRWIVSRLPSEHEKEEK